MQCISRHRAQHCYLHRRGSVAGNCGKHLQAAWGIGRQYLATFPLGSNARPRCPRAGHAAMFLDSACAAGATVLDTLSPPCARRQGLHREGLSGRPHYPRPKKKKKILLLRSPSLRFFFFYTVQFRARPKLSSQPQQIRRARRPSRHDAAGRGGPLTSRRACCASMGHSMTDPLLSGTSGRVSVRRSHMQERHSLRLQIEQPLCTEDRSRSQRAVATVMAKIDVTSFTFAHRHPAARCGS